MGLVIGLLLLVFVILCFTVIPYGVQVLIGGFLLFMFAGWLYRKLGSGD